MTRRQALGLTAVGVVATATGGVGLWRTAAAGGDGAGVTGGSSGAATGGALAEPTSLRSTGGRLDVTLRASAGTVDVAGRRIRALSYNGGLPGPTLRVAPGDRLSVRLVNDLDEPTNLHVHGLHVSPRGHSDNVFVSIAPGGSFDYAYDLPADHPPGVYWYHPHHHGTVADQVFGGLYGAIVVEDPAGAEVAADRERVLVVSDTSVEGGGVAEVSRMERMAGREGELVLLNGLRRPVLTLRDGARERWRVVNACTSRYLRLRAPGREVRLLGIDSGRFADPEVVAWVDLAPGNRADLLVDVGSGSGSLVTDAVDRGGPGRGQGMRGRSGSTGSEAGGQVVLADIETRPGPTPASRTVPTGPGRSTIRDLRSHEVARRRRHTLAMGMGGGMGGGMGVGTEGSGPAFTIDGRSFDHERVDVAPALGDVEEWTFVNTTPMDHPMHLHVWPMQLTGPEQEGRPPRWQDVVNVPADSEVTVRIAFEDFDGRAVQHCHILDHEDLGMMGTVEVR